MFPHLTLICGVCKSLGVWSVGKQRATGLLLSAPEAWKSTAAAQRCFHNNQALPCHTGPSSTSRVSTSSSSALFAQRIAFPKHTREEEQTPEEHTPPTHTDTQKKRRNRRTPVSCGGLGDAICCSCGWVVLGHWFVLQDETENQVVGNTWRGNSTEGYGRAASLELGIELHAEHWSCSNIHTLQHNIHPRFLKRKKAPAWVPLNSTTNMSIVFQKPCRPFKVLFEEELFDFLYKKRQII